MLKKAFSVLFVLSLSACSNNDTSFNQQVLTNDSNVQTSSTATNGVSSYSINEGSAGFVFNKQGSGEQYISTNPNVVSLYIKKLGIKFGDFNHGSLTTPTQKLGGYFYLGNDSNLYVADYDSKDYYKIGTWSKKDKFKGQGYINLKDSSYKDFSQSFDVKLDPVISKVTAETHLNPMSHEYLFLEASQVLKPVKKTAADFDLSKFIMTK